MSESIQIRYGEVYGNVAELRNRIRTSIHEMEAEHRQIQSNLNRVDGATNARLMSAVERNSRKAHTVAETLDKLLEFIKSSTQQVEIEEQRMQAVFQSSQLSGGAEVR